MLYRFASIVTAALVLALSAAAQCGGILAPCPCPQPNVVMGGCANSVTHLSPNEGFPGTLVGGWLRVGPAQHPLPAVSNDQIQLFVERLPTNTQVLFFQGTGWLNGLVFGDGLRCVGGTVTRLGIRTTGNGAPPQLGLTSIGGYPDWIPISVLGNVPPQGGLRYYQAWYRNADPTFCTAATFNMTNAVEVWWQP